MNTSNHSPMYYVLWHGYRDDKEVTKEQLRHAVEEKWITETEMNMILTGVEA